MGDALIGAHKGQQGAGEVGDGDPVAVGKELRRRAHLLAEHRRRRQRRRSTPRHVRTPTPPHRRPRLVPSAILLFEPHRHNLSSYVASHPCQYGDDTSGISLKICNKKISFAQLISRASTYRAASKVDFFLL